MELAERNSERMSAEALLPYFRLDHLRSLKRRIDDNASFSETKLCRRLAWMQAALYASGIASLDDLSRDFACQMSSGRPKVALAGSIQFLRKMSLLRNELAAHGLDSELPLSVPLDTIDPVGQRARLAKRFMDIVGRADLAALLIVNSERDGMRHYVGASTFSEAAVAFSKSKPIYLLEDLPQGLFREELMSFGAIPLNGDLSSLVASVVG